MSVQNGQRGNAATFNSSFMSREVDTDTIGKVDLLNPDSAPITDVQATINDLQDQIDNLTTDEVAEGATNKYFSGKTTDDLPEGSINTYYSDAQVQSLLADTAKDKDLDFGTASNLKRVTLPKDTKANLDSLTRKEGSIYYATDEDKVYYDNGSELKAVGSGGAGVGGINYFGNPYFIDSLSGVSSVSLTFELTTENPLFPTISPNNLKVIKPASNVFGQQVIFTPSVITYSDITQGMQYFEITIDARNAGPTNEWVLYIVDTVNNKTVNLEMGVVKTYGFYYDLQDTENLEMQLIVADSFSDGGYLLVNGIKMMSAPDAKSIGEFKDVNLDGVQDGQVLEWNETDGQFKPADIAAGGLTNYSLNPYFKRGDDNVSSSSVDLTFAVDGTNPVEASKSAQSLKVSKAASNIDGEFIAFDSLITDKSVLNSGLAKVGLILDTLTDTNYVHNFYKIVVVDPATSAVLNVGDTFVERGSIKRYEVLINLPAGVDDPKVRLVAVGTNATAFDIWVGGHFVEALGQFAMDGVTPWEPVTVTGTFTNTTYTAKRRYVGKNAEYQIGMVLTGTPANATLDINLPTGDVIDTSVMNDITQFQTAIQGAQTRIFDSGTASYPSGGIVYNTATSVRPDVMNLSGGSRNNITQAVPMTWTSGDKAWFYFSVPLTRLPISNTLTNYELGLQTARVGAAYKTPTGTLGSSWNKVTFPTLDVNRFMSYNPSTGQLVANTKGTLLTSVQLEITHSSSAAAVGVRVNNITKNETLRGAEVEVTRTRSFPKVMGSLELNAGDVVEIQSYSEAGGASYTGSFIGSNAFFYFLPDFTLYNAIPDNEDRELHLTGGNGFGSTNTFVRRFTTPKKNTLGSWATYTDSATLGSYVVFHKPCKIHVTATDRRAGGSNTQAIVINGTAGNASVSLAYDNGARFPARYPADMSSPSTGPLNMKVGDVLWLQHEGNASFTTGEQATLTINIISGSY